MNYPVHFSRDMKQLAAFYEWNEDDKLEIRASFKNSPEMVHYFTVLAAAHRAGYKQGASNGHVRLKEWCKSKGLDDPYCLGFDANELDLMALHEKQLLS